MPRSTADPCTIFLFGLLAPTGGEPSMRYAAGGPRNRSRKMFAHLRLLPTFLVLAACVMHFEGQATSAAVAAQEIKISPRQVRVTYALAPRLARLNSNQNYRMADVAACDARVQIGRALAASIRSVNTAMFPNGLEVSDVDGPGGSTDRHLLFDVEEFTTEWVQNIPWSIVSRGVRAAVVLRLRVAVHEDQHPTSWFVVSGRGKGEAGGLGNPVCGCIAQAQAQAASVAMRQALAEYAIRVTADPRF